MNFIQKIFKTLGGEKTDLTDKIFIDFYVQINKMNNYSIKYCDNGEIIRFLDISVDPETEQKFGENIFANLNLDYKKGYFIYNDKKNNGEKPTIVYIEMILFDFAAYMFEKLCFDTNYSKAIKIDENSIFISVFNKSVLGQDYFFVFGEIKSFDYILNYFEMVSNKIEVKYSKEVMENFVEYFI